MIFQRTHRKKADPGKSRMPVSKPNCTGQKFGWLTVLEKTDGFLEYGKKRVHHRLWRLQCDCGRIVEMTRSQFDTKRSPKLCCGCKVRDRRQERAIKSTEDLTGQVFGFLTVIGSTYEGSKTGRRLWILRCQCEKVIRLEKHTLTRKKGGQKSCGCLRCDYKQGGRACDLTGQRFGSLVAIERIDERKDRRPLWRLQCDCGNTTKMSVSRIRDRIRTGCRLNCGDRVAHPDIGHHYPATPSPYPHDAGRLLEKYLSYTKTRCQRVRADILDERMDRLIRVCWILTYRRQQGEELTELYERQIILKYMRYASIRVMCRENQMRYSERVNKPRKERAMFTKRSLSYPVSESQTSGNNLTTATREPRRLKFCRR